MEVIERANRKSLRRWQQILDAIPRAADLNEDDEPHHGLTDPSGKPADMTWRQYQVAKDARKPVKLAPMYVGLAARVVGEANKLTAERHDLPNLNVDVKIFVRGDTTDDYQVVDLDPVKRLR